MEKRRDEPALQWSMRIDEVNPGRSRIVVVEEEATGVLVSVVEEDAAAMRIGAPRC